MSKRLKLTKPDPGFRLKAEDGGKRLRIDIYDAIGFEEFGGVSAKAVRDALKDHDDAEQIDVHLNSPGGMAYDGLTIYNLLAQHKAHVTTHIDGLAASAASLVAMAGDEIAMAENAMMMIHNAGSIMIGQAKDMRAEAEVLEKLDRSLATTYAKRSGGDPETIASMMDETTWFTADEAVADGLADRIVDAKKIAAFDGDLLKLFTDVPADVAAQFTQQAQPGDGTGEPQTETDPMDEITPEAFAERYPDAVAQWKVEGATEARKQLAEFVDLADGDVAIACEKFTANADSVEVIRASRDKAKAEAEEARKLAERDGTDLVQTDTAADRQGGEDPIVASIHKQAESIKNTYAREQFIRNELTRRGLKTTKH